ncbi:MAG: aromatic ring-hydroxylating dioxygenase subunit alpha [Myxococcaceae bacterium]|nr:aromatic ring-hydroxylating dioxygenase subunit alpha [Myxococcaceae bacterium]
MRYVDTRPKTEVGTMTLPAGYYADPGYFARELEAVHLRMWLYAGRVEDVPEPGSYVLRQVANASVVLVRDEGGHIRAFHNVCRHRGTRLCKEASGRFSGTIQCKYHAWTYRLDGTLKKAPHMENVAGFREEDWPLSKVHVATWDGLLFISFAEDPIPFSEHLNGMDTRFRNWRMHELVTVERRVYQLRANWKLIIQNYHECLHCPIAHPQLQRITHFLSGDNEPPQPTWLGSRMDLGPGFTTLTADGKTRRRPLPHLTDEERRHVYYYAVLPNMLLNLAPDYVVTFMFNPQGVDRTEVTCHWLMHPDEVARPGFDPSDAVDFWHLTNEQDWELSDLAQAGISSRGYRPGPFSNREEMLTAMDRWVLERVGTL